MIRWTANQSLPRICNIRFMRIADSEVNLELVVVHGAVLLKCNDISGAISHGILQRHQVIIRDPIIIVKKSYPLATGDVKQSLTLLANGHSLVVCECQNLNAIANRFQLLLQVLIERSPILLYSTWNSKN